MVTDKVGVSKDIRSGVTDNNISTEELMLVLPYCVYRQKYLLTLILSTLCSSEGVAIISIKCHYRYGGWV